MKIFLVHNRYQQKGGEDSVLASEKKLLLDHGHEVIEYIKDNHEISSYSPVKRLSLVFATTWSSKSYDEVVALLQKYRPDIAHFHNTLPLITPSVYYACHAQGVPVVQTLHNYRLICPGALLLRNGKICEDCLTGSVYKSVAHRCYRGSAPGTYAVARMIDYHRKRGAWKNKVDRFIALTNFARAKFVEGGLPAEKIAVKPNFADVPVRPDINNERTGALYVGRLSREKGISTLIRAWRKLDTGLRIAGDGPMMDEVINTGLHNITALGLCEPEKVKNEMERSEFLVMPSQWYEGFPMVLVEAFAHGLPVIASRLGGMAEIVEDGATGLHFTPGDADDLAEKVNWMISHPDERKRMGENARHVYEEKYTPERNYEMLIDIYRQAIKERRVKNDV
ncbi:Glycosyl transferase, group 1 [hydrothermal vent metagenome]|uniref:Glycosyl transferase, group 1 n=1 Tax=hydrothermal vent metagenome TaxID=652676 RepID=A0A3B1CL27_9ZZZZ